VTEWTTANLGFGRAFADSIIAALKTAPANPLINLGKLRLSKDPAFAPTPGSAIADLTPHEADFSGYPAGGAAVVLSAPVNLSAACQGGLFSQTFVGVGGPPFVGNQIYGYWVDDGTNVICFEPFGAAGFSDIGVVGDFLTLNLQIPEQLLQATV
jgi:hypothetical protein